MSGLVQSEIKLPPKGHSALDTCRVLLLAEGKPMFSDGRTISDEFMLAVEPSLSHLFLPRLVQAGVNNINMNLPVHYKSIHWLQ